jgi:phosphoribosylformimino-5-aminoimidazole carboxamide ribotide isomerase
MQEHGVIAIIYTDIKRDGMLSGPNIEATQALARALHIPVIASGGVHTMKDIENLLMVRHSGISGVITGKAIYSGSLNLKEAITFVRMNDNQCAR